MGQASNLVIARREATRQSRFRYVLKQDGLFHFVRNDEIAGAVEPRLITKEVRIDLAFQLSYPNPTLHLHHRRHPSRHRL